MIRNWTLHHQIIVIMNTKMMFYHIHLTIFFYWNFYFYLILLRFDANIFTRKKKQRIRNRCILLYTIEFIPSMFNVMMLNSGFFCDRLYCRFCGVYEKKFFNGKYLAWNWKESKQTLNWNQVCCFYYYQCYSWREKNHSTNKGMIGWRCLLTALAATHQQYTSIRINKIYFQSGSRLIIIANILINIKILKPAIIWCGSLFFVLQVKLKDRKLCVIAGKGFVFYYYFFFCSFSLLSWSSDKNMNVKTKYLRMQTGAP